MAGSRQRGRYGHTSGLDIDRLRADLARTLPVPKEVTPIPETEAVGSEPEPEDPRAGRD